MSLPPEPPLRLILCDDDLVLSGALALLIKYTSGLELVAEPVQTGQSAVDAVMMHRPDLVLMDVDLGGDMNGFEATRLIKEISPRTSVVVMSGMANTEHALAASLQAGAFGFLSKADVSSQLLDTLFAAGRARGGRVAVQPQT